MKKMVLLAAFVAAGAAFVACSSNDDLVQAPTAPEETIDEGTPLTIKVTDATRGTDWTATSLPSFSLYTIANGGTERWLGANDEGSSKGQFYQNDGSGNFVSGTLENETFTASSVAWKQTGAWDFYALSNKDATSYFDFAQSGGADLEDFARETGRNFTYTVPTDYNSQKDLLVGAAMNKSMSGGDVEIPFYHALAQIGSITFTFSDLNADNSAYTFIIKSASLCNLNSQGKYTFPDEWNATNSNAWSDLSLPEEYEIEFPDFGKDDKGYYNIFSVDDSQLTDDPSSRAATDYATGTNAYRVGTTIPNYFRCPNSLTTNTTTSHTFSYTLPLAKKSGSAFSIDADENPTHPTFTQDGGLYVLPQSLTKTVWSKDGEGYIDGVSEGVYLKVIGIVLNRNTPGNDFYASFDDYFLGSEHTFSLTGNANNYYVTECLNKATDNANGAETYYIPLIKATKAMKAGHLYNLTFDLSKAVTTTDGDAIFAGASVE